MPPACSSGRPECDGSAVQQNQLPGGQLVHEIPVKRRQAFIAAEDRCGNPSITDGIAAHKGLGRFQRGWLNEDTRMGDQAQEACAHHGQQSQPFTIGTGIKGGFQPPDGPLVVRTSERNADFCIFCWIRALDQQCRLGVLVNVTSI